MGDGTDPRLYLQAKLRSQKGILEELNDKPLLYCCTDVSIKLKRVEFNVRCCC